MIWYTAFTAQQMRHVTETLVSSFAYTADRELLFDRLAVIHVPSGSDDGRSSAPEQVVAGTQQALRDCDALLADLQAAATRYAEERLDGSLPDSALEAYLKRWSS